MKNLLLLTIFIFLSISFIAKSQTKLNNTDNTAVQNISQEKIFVHLNTSFLITGEFLYYKVYCINNETKDLSKFSKIAYVELINSNKEIVFKHKVILKNGMGQGDFFVPASLGSGNYKLIAYTQWMRNVEISNFYQNDISIINPFQENQTPILNEQPLLKNNSNNIEKTDTKRQSRTSVTNDLISLQVNSDSFSKREKVNINIRGSKDVLSYGNYSISVRKVDDLNIPPRNTATDCIDTSKNISPTLTNNSIRFLPELRGELLSGKVVIKESGLPVANVKVALSIPGKNYIFKIANTNKNGNYYFNIGKEYNNENASIQILEKDRDKYLLQIQKQLPVNYSNIQFYNFKISAADKELILNHSICNQIENAYASKKPDSILSIKAIPPFFNNTAKTYLLDDYTRFRTLKETFIEIIPEIYSRQRNGIFTFHVRIFDKEIESGLSPLVLIDGNLIQDQTELIDFNTDKIEKISIVTDMYMYGAKLFEGIISINTFKGNYQNSIINDHRKNIKLSKPLATKKYFNQIYTKDSKLDRIPDFRRQLLWMPDIQLNSSNKNIYFYTSDMNGAFEICLEGFNNNGEPVSIKKVIYVKDNKKN